MKFLRFVWKLFVMAAVFGTGYIVGREHSFEEEEQWEAENRKNSENNDRADGEKSDACTSCLEKQCEGCETKETAKVCEAEGSEKEVTFEYENESAVKVAVVGSFNKWNKDADQMAKEGNTWQLAKKLKSGTYEYQFVVNDTDWVVDPKSEAIVENKYEGKNSVVIVK